ncbi:IS110 family transposase [Amycolatopsis orientalis]|uniref:IS110 family transposase n=1 Tax=Amycolatopsis orientalis TaxID=31958 RepID=UPI00039FEDFC|nr:IS110 family transposase [Amycolatopsis orientalis]
MVVIGVDPHKSSHTAAALEPGAGAALGTVRVEAALPGYRRLLAWGRGFGQRRWAVENAWGLGRHLAQWLVARGETVVDVPATATARVRQLSRGRRKNDALDAAAAAGVAALQGDGGLVAAEGASTVLGMLDERRSNLARQRTRTVNQLHALLRDLLPGGAPAGLTAGRAAGILAGIRPASPAQRARKDLARDLVEDLRALDGRLKTNRKRMQDAVAESGSSLPGIAGVGPAVAARLLGRTGRASRFPTAAAFAVHAGAAPVEIASADKTRHRLSRRGDRRLNNALHTIALTQARMPGTRGRVYYDAKIAEGKTRNEAMRCLKRRLADHVWRVMTADERREAPAAGPGGHTGTTLTSSAAGPTPTADSSDKSLPGPATHNPTAPNHTP